MASSVTVSKPDRLFLVGTPEQADKCNPLSEILGNCVSGRCQHASRWWGSPRVPTVSYGAPLVGSLLILPAVWSGWVFRR